jgi:hypothetical protein
MTYTNRYQAKATRSARGRFNAFVVVVAVVAFGFVEGFAQVTWRTTHTTNGTMNTGSTTLEASSMRVKVFPSHVDVEEDVTIRVSGTVSAANDANTLEIVANFTLPLGSAITGALLWDGDRLLQAKLLDRFKADSIYEDLVDRDSLPPPRPIDPIILERTAANSYRMKVYPVTLNGMRRMRLRYQLPPRLGVEGFETRLQAALIPFYTPTTTSFPVTIENGGGMPSVAFVESGLPRELTLPRTIFIPRSSLTAASATHATNSTRILPVNRLYQLQARTSFDTGSFMGHYLSLFATVEGLGNFPDLSTRSVVARVRNSQRAYDLTMWCSPSGDSLACSNLQFYGKSITPWQDTVVLEAYSIQGTLLGTIKNVPTLVSNMSDSSLMRIWAASTSPFSEKQEPPLGPTYGFVDQWASLLALERDSLSPALKAAYADTGVPNSGPVPGYLGPSTASSISNATGRAQVSAWKLERLARGAYVMRVPGMVPGTRIELALFDLTGKRIGQWYLTTGADRLTWNPGLIKPGTYVIQLKGPNLSGRKIVLL